MRNFDVKSVLRSSVVPVRMFLATTLGVAGLSVAALNASTASAGITSQGRLVAPDSRLAPKNTGPGTWSNAEEVPGTAALNTGLNAGIYSISCSSSGNCSAGGNYVDSSGNYQAFVVNESAGTWGTSIEVPGTYVLNAGGSAIVNSVSCSSAGNCGAAGGYTDSSGNFQGFVVNETNGTWGIAGQVVDPSAVGSPNALGAESISCTGDGSCTATGDDIISGGDSVGFAVGETGGTWSDAEEITISSAFGAGGTSLDTVSCSSPGNCSAAGNGLFPDSAVSGGFANIPFEANQTSGTWDTPVVYPGLAALNVGLNSVATTISCSSVGNCSAGGSYVGATATFQAFVASEKNGTWGNAVEVPGTSALNIGGAFLSQLSCTSSNSCGGVGAYTDVSGNDQAFVVNETNGAWANAVEIPYSSTLFNQGIDTYPVVISCSTPEICSAGGSYYDASGNEQAFVVDEREGMWINPIEVPGTAGLDTAGGANVASISCSADTSCGAAGWYSTGSNEYQAFTSDMVAQFATQTPLQLTSTHGVVGTVLKLRISGGSGNGGLAFSAVDRTAKGCIASGNNLKATSPGTCLVTVTKSGDPTYLASSSTATVSMALPAKPKALTVEFVGASNALTGSTEHELRALAKKLIAGASITVTGFAIGNARLAKSRADAVQRYLELRVHLRVTDKTNTVRFVNAVTVVTTKQ
jgi:hypothetical protein